MDNTKALTLQCPIERIVDTTMIKELLAKKSYLLSKAQALEEIGMAETVQPLFLSAAAYEERIAALLDTEACEQEAAVHRISAASCYARADHLSQAVNLYRAALAGPLLDHTRAEVLQLLRHCLARLAQQSAFQGMPSPLIAVTPA